MSEKFPEPNSLDSMEGVPSKTPENPEMSEKPDIFELTSDMWQKYKALRLKSAETDPQAWGKSVQTEPEKDEMYWRQKLDDP